MCVATDAGTKRRLALILIFESVPLPRGCELWKLLSKLSLLDLHTGPLYFLTMSPDDRHLLKRLLRALREDRGLLIAYVKVNKSALRVVLSKLPGMRNVEGLLNPPDAMSVPNAMQLAEAIVKAADTLSAHDFEDAAEMQQLLAAMKVAAHVINGILAIFDTKLTISEQLTRVSTTVHLVAFLAHAQGLNLTDFLPGVLAHDIQAWGKNIFFCMAKVL